MGKNVDEILINELGKVIHITDKLVKPKSPLALREISGRLGINMASKFLKNNDFEITKDIRMQAKDFLVKAYEILQSEGEILTDLGYEYDRTIVGAVVGAGAMNLNPTIVLVCVNYASTDVINVTIRGIAKEGLIKQYAGEKAAKRIAQKLF